ncbi:MAG TPA: Crp/Fnr family transcriptional regulator [Candidatus Saccharimonadales bacterium]
MASAAEKVRETFTKYPKRTYPKGQILVFADENPEHIFYMTKGRVRKYDVSYRGDEVIINIFQPPSFFPMSWALNHTPNRFFYKTETEVELHVVPVSVALELLEQNPDVTIDLLRRLYTGLEGMYGRLLHLMAGTAKSRLVYELIIECHRFGEKQADGSCVLRVSETDLAARSGLSRETVSREMRKVKEHDGVTISKNSIRIKDIAALEAVLGDEV